SPMMRCLGKSRLSVPKSIACSVPPSGSRFRRRAAVPGLRRATQQKRTLKGEHCSVYKVFLSTEKGYLCWSEQCQVLLATFAAYPRFARLFDDYLPDLT